LLTLAAAGSREPVDMSWEDNYKPWRIRETVPFSKWLANIPQPIPAPSPEEWAGLDIDSRRAHFSKCITDEAIALSKHVQTYQSPDLGEIQRVGLSVSVSKLVC
jgi:hypothetical protein